MIPIWVARDLMLAALFAVLLTAYENEHEARCLAEAHLDRCEELGPQGGTDQAMAERYPDATGMYAFPEKRTP